jgi:ribosomal protein S7
VKELNFFAQRAKYSVELAEKKRRKSAISYLVAGLRAPKMTIHQSLSF